ncbi:hypothetical protein D9M68_638220 [compost metagenome]
MQIAETFSLHGAPLDQVEHVLGAGQLFANGRAQRTHDRLPGPGQALVLLFQQVIGEWQ